MITISKPMQPDELYAAIEKISATSVMGDILQKAGDAVILLAQFVHSGIMVTYLN